MLNTPCSVYIFTQYLIKQSLIDLNLSWGFYDEGSQAWWLTHSRGNCLRRPEARKDIKHRTVGVLERASSRMQNENFSDPHMIEERGRDLS